MKVLKKFIKKILAQFLSPKKLRILTKPMLVPDYYREFVDSVEQIIDNKSYDADYWAQILRKNAHIVDKGLNRLDCEPGHSKGIYELATDAAQKLKNPTNKVDPSIVWASGIINQYEELQLNKGYIKKKYELKSFKDNDYIKLLDVIKSRRSIRAYKEKVVDDDVLKRVLEGINWASSSCNKQPFKVHVTNNPDIVNKALSTCKGFTGFSDYVPVFLSFCVDLRAYWMPKEMLLPVLDTALGIQNCALIATSLGLSMTMLSWAQHTNEEDKYLRELLKIPGYFQIVVNATLGYPLHDVETPVRKSINNSMVLIK